MDYFDRQKRIKGWDQSLLSSCTAVCFGVGGLGSFVSISLCRLGVGRIILIDYDVVDTHNLNRQLLFTVHDIGGSKVEAAKANLDKFHNLSSTIEAYNLNIVENWGQVMSLVSNATVLFNMIDYGDYFDVAAQSFCVAKNIPFVQGGTFSQCISIDFFWDYQKSCLACSNELNREILEKIKPNEILTLEDLKFLPKNNNPTGLSNVYLCGTCAELMVAKFGEHLLRDPEIKISNRTIFYINTMESTNFDVERKENCCICIGIN